ncbi:MAG: putative lipopolysaccharide heptosyltransferase III [Chthoniobacterales bacterium]
MNILLIQLRRIGDLVLTTPAIAAVREKFPRANLSLVISAATRELLPAIPHVDRAFVARGKISDARSWFDVARRKYDYCLDFTRSDRSAFVTLLSGARKRITADYPRRRGQLQSMSYNTLVPLDVGCMHTVDYHLGLLEPLGIRKPSRQLRLDLPASALQSAAQLLTKTGVRGDFVLLHPGSARKEKFWEADRWAAVINHAAKRGLMCVITGGRATLEQEHIAQIRRLTRTPFLDLSRKIDLLMLAAVIKHARLVVTIDSAPVHLAAATQTPQVALFGPTNPLHWHPRFTPAIILQAGEAAPVTQFSPNQKSAPMNLISTHAVIDAMDALLATQRVASV